MKGTETDAAVATVLWRRMDTPGLEQCTVRQGPQAVEATGGVVMLDEQALPWHIEYEVRCDATWATRGVRLKAHAGGDSRDLTLETDAAGRWRVNGTHRPDLQGCTDVDLGFSPFTNTLPIRRLRLGVKQSGTIEAAWVEFPTLAVKRVSQRYSRIGEHAYRYDNLPTGFTAEIVVDEAGLVVSYPPGWERVSATPRLQDVLISAAPSPELGDAAALYAALIGSWDVDVVDYAADGSRLTSEGEWHFSWALEGRAVQDILIVPRRNARGGSPMPKRGNRYGTTVRYFDRASGQWQIIWINPVTGAVNRLAARKEGDWIVQVGTDPDGKMRRWCFTEVTPERFRWTGEESADGGKTWRLGAEFAGRRR